MNKQELADLINTKVTSYREYRIKYANLIIDNKELFLPLLEIAFDESNEASVKVSWVLDFVMREKLEWIYPYLDFYTDNIPKIKNDSAVRPMARTCELLAKEYAKNNSTEIHKYLSSIHKDKIIEACFDWLISDHKVAVKVYSMESLFFFGKEVDWVHDELKTILQQEIAYGSPAYKARGKKMLKWIDKMNN